MMEESRKTQMVFNPEVTAEVLSRISALVEIQEREVFMKLVLSYWKLKRIQRNGAPLLPLVKSVTKKT